MHFCNFFTYHNVILCHLCSSAEQLILSFCGSQVSPMLCILSINSRKSHMLKLHTNVILFQCLQVERNQSEHVTENLQTSKLTVVRSAKPEMLEKFSFHQPKTVAVSRLVKLSSEIMYQAILIYHSLL